MPEHVHLVVKPRHEIYDVSKFQETLKKSVVRKAHSFRKKSSKPDEYWARFYDVQPNGERHFRFWQRGGAYDENIWSLEAIPEILQYIHNNPVRRGLCEAPEDWPWSSAGWYAGRSGGSLKLELPDF